jgi:hypothetical protein
MPTNSMPAAQDFKALAAIAHDLRVDVLTMLEKAGSGHPGGSLGMADAFTVLWFGGYLNTDPQNPQWQDRDRFILSNGHICPILYAILAKKGYFPREDLWTLRKLGSPLQGHPDFHHTRGVDCCTGSLGNGVSVALGMALGARLTGRTFRVFAAAATASARRASSGRWPPPPRTTRPTTSRSSSTGTASRSTATTATSWTCATSWPSSRPSAGTPRR